MARAAQCVALAAGTQGGCVPLLPDQPGPDASMQDVEQGAIDESPAALVSDDQGKAKEQGKATEAGDAEDGCASECEAGALQCSATGIPQACVMRMGCAAWADMTACDEDGGQVATCCNGACVAVSDLHCFGCATCDKASSTPICDHDIRACGCTSALCTKKNKLCDGSTHACVDPPPGPKVWVDPSADLDGAVPDGSLAHPYPTITAALKAVPGLDAGAVDSVEVHVAAGTYDEAHGESFPMVVRGGVSLIGSGRETTVIRGSGIYAAPLEPAAYGSRPPVTLVMGDRDKVNRISKLTLRPSYPKTGILFPVGLLCDQGNVPKSGADVPSANSQLSDLALSPDYQTGVIVSTAGSDASGGCNLQLTGSFVQGTTGLWAIGCDDRSGFPDRQRQVAVGLGDGTSAGANTFQNNNSLDLTGTSAVIGDCVVRFAALGNQFKNSDTGIAIRQPLRGQPNQATIRDNTFDSMTRGGLLLAGGDAVVDELVGNKFQNGAITSTSVGLSLIGLKGDLGFCKITKARGNEFVNNDVGVVIQSAYLFPSMFEAVNFGTAGDPGGNTIHCNSRPPASSGVGGDVVVDLDLSVSDSVTFHFAGNTWDHNPPTSSLLSLRTNGMDYAVRDDKTITLDVGDAAVAGSCTGRTP